MSPSLSIYYSADVVLADTESSGDFSLRHAVLYPHFVDGLNIIIRQFVHRVVLSPLSRLAKHRANPPRLPFKPSLFKGILCVVHWGSWKQVGRVAAWWVVAVMAYINSIWRGPVSYLKRNPVSQKVLSLIFNLSVTGFSYGTHPQPAFRFEPYFYPRKESLNELVPSAPPGSGSRFTPSYPVGMADHGHTMSLITPLVKLELC